MTSLNTFQASNKGGNTYIENQCDRRVQHKLVGASEEMFPMSICRRMKKKLTMEKDKYQEMRRITSYFSRAYNNHIRVRTHSILI